MTDLTREFAAALAGVERPGDFCTCGTIEIPAPGLFVDGVGRVALPLLPGQAAELVSVADKAPYGRGEATIVDEGVRRTWQIDPRKVHITGRHWAARLEHIVERAGTGLGVAGPVEAQFYKLLVYDEGSFFVGHRDTEKCPGMFATLVIVLAGDGCGGELVVRHQGREVRMGLRVDDPAEAAFAAFYADCVHEVLPVTAGHRLTLVYNLVRRGAGNRPRPPNYDSEVARLAALLRRWPVPDAPTPDEPRRTDGAMAIEHDDEVGVDDPEDFWDDDEDEDASHADVMGRESDTGLQKIVYPLAHAYTPAELSFAALKGADAAAAGVLIAAAQLANCEVHLAHLVIAEYGAAEQTGYGYSRRRSRHDEDEDEFEIVEVDGVDRTLSHWQRPDATSSRLGPIPVMDVELSPTDAIVTMEPDEMHFQEATGNEGASFERTYRRAALVVWPRARAFAVLSQAGLAATMPALTEMVMRSKTGDDGDAAAQQRAAADLAGHMIADWRPYPTAPHSEAAAYPTTFLGLLRHLGDAGLVRRFMIEVVARGACSQADNPAILDAIEALPAPERSGLLARVVADRSKNGFAACADLLLGAASRPKAQPRQLAEAAAALVATLPGDPATADLGRMPKVQPTFVADLVRLLPMVDEVLAARAVDHMLRWPKSYPLDDVIVPALRQSAAGRTEASPAIGRLRAAALAHLDGRIAVALVEPADERRDGALRCSCKDCASVASFLADPRERVWRLKAAQPARSHVEEVVRRAGADVDATTDAKGRPHSLVLTKNKASYLRRSKQRAQDLKDRAAIAL